MGISGERDEDKRGGDPLVVALGRGDAEERNHSKDGEECLALQDKESDSNDEGKDEEALASRHEKKTETDEGAGVWSEGDSVEGGGEVVDLGLEKAEGQ